jgi:hypothetical protein
MAHGIIATGPVMRPRQLVIQDNIVFAVQFVWRVTSTAWIGASVVTKTEFAVPRLVREALCFMDCQII